MGQDEIVIHLEQRHLILHARFALAQGVDPAPDRRHPVWPKYSNVLLSHRVRLSHDARCNLNFMALLPILTFT
jgi:hypothetical protein